jgi:mono/diheme cytochrome c family protein
MKTTKAALLLCITAALLGGLAGCDVPERLRTDAELGLNPAQARGHHLFDRHCATCHAAYSPHVYKGPSLQGMFKKPYLKTGAPANDERVREIIVVGHNKMPAYARVLTQEQIDDLMEYLHTL